jgi:hypothetical protein
MLPGCETMTTHNGGYCCADHCKSHKKLKQPNDPKLSHGANNRKREFAANLQMKEQPPLAPARC